MVKRYYSVDACLYLVKLRNSGSKCGSTGPGLTGCHGWQPAGTVNKTVANLSAAQSWPTGMATPVGVPGCGCPTVLDLGCSQPVFLPGHQGHWGQGDGRLRLRSRPTATRHGQ